MCDRFRVGSHERKAGKLLCLRAKCEATVMFFHQKKQTRWGRRNFQVMTRKLSVTQNYIKYCMQDTLNSNGETRIMEVFKYELFPSLDELKKLIVDIHNLRIIYLLYSRKLNKYNLEYQNISKKFFIILQKIDTPDILFNDLVDNPQNMISYFNFEPIIIKKIDEGLKYIEIIDRVLDRKRQYIFNSWTLFLSIIAICLSIFFAIHNK